MIHSHAVLAIGPQGSGKSHLAYTALRHYGSGIVVLARGLDELNSYYPLYERPSYTFKGFDDPDFQVALGQRKATGFQEAIDFLGAEHQRLKALKDAGQPLDRQVLVFDTASAFGQLAMNKTLSKFNVDEPPPVRGERGYPFFSHLSKAQEGLFAKGRALRDLGLHWIVLAQAAEREVTPGQAAVNEGMLKTQIMAAVPGGFRDTIGQFFDLVFQVQALPVVGKAPKHQMLYLPDPKRNTKSRWGDLTRDLKPIENDWPKVLAEVERLAKEREGA